MTIAEAHRAFRFGLDKMDGLNYPNFLPEEIDLLLNQAQERIIKQRYGKNNIKRASFEEEQKRTEDLKEIIQTRIALPQTPGIYGNSASNATFFDLTDDHWFIIWEKAIINCPSCNTNNQLPPRNP